MERLTIKRDEKNVFQSMYYAECKEYADGCGVISCPFDCPCEIEQALFDRLGAIEEILGDGYDLDRLRELVEADREGRCVVLPCKIGDVIYQIVRHRNSGTVEIIQYFVNAVETEECGVTVKAHRWKPTSSVFLSQKVPNWVKVSDFGKTVFLTREAAEAALKGDQHG